MAVSKDNLRSGYTTGACATAATKGALLALIDQQSIDAVAIHLPAGVEAMFAVHSCVWSADAATASVIKDAGDDPDVTHGAEIRVRVAWREATGVVFERGPGVGLVTKPGLPVAPGEPAINPVPRRMMTEVVNDVLAAAGLGTRGVIVEISIPGGEELALKTYNPRLGIIGGLSILGTTGIVVPYSTDAWLASVVQAIDVAVAQGYRRLVFVVGAQGERAAHALCSLPDDAFIQVGPFFGAALRHCGEAGVEAVSIVAMIGKLAKFAAGNESVHSTASRQDFDFLADVARAAGLPDATCLRIVAANTAQEAAELALAAGEPRFFSHLTDRAWRFAHGLARVETMEIILVGRHGEVLSRSAGEPHV